METLRAFKFVLDPTAEQTAAMKRHAGASRWAYNHALAAKVAAYEEWRTQVADLVETGVEETAARKRVKVPIPTKPRIQKAWNAAKGDSRKDVDGCCPWWHEVSTYAFQSAFNDADAAWKNWLDSYSGKRAGRRVGYPRFKAKGRARDSFRLHHDVKKPTIRLTTYRRLRLPRIGDVRLHDSGKRLGRLVERGRAVVQSVTVSRTGDRWYASVLCKVEQDLPERPTRRQAAAGTVGVDVGVKVLAALSKPLPDGRTLVENPRHVRAAEKRLAKAQRALSRTQKRSARREKAQRRVARLHRQVAERRAGTLHQLTKQLATGYATVAIEDLCVAGMTRSSRGTSEAPGKRVRQKAGLNKAILDVAPGELRRQLAYKTSWYGSKLAVLDRWHPSSKTCSDCGWRNPSLTLTDRTFHCGNETCKLVMDRDLNAARNIERHAVSPDQQSPATSGETQNALPSPGKTDRPSGWEARALKREDTDPLGSVPSQRGDPLAFLESACRTGVLS